MRKLFAFTCLIVAVLFAVPASAASIDIGLALGETVQQVVQLIVTSAITALVGWGGYLLTKFTGIKIEAMHRETLRLFLERQASSLVAQGVVKLKGVKIEVDNVALANAANTALQAIPQAAAFFGLTPAMIAEKIVSVIPNQPAISEATAIAIDVQNPGTPSKA